MIYGLVAIPMTLSDLHVHAPNEFLLKCDFFCKFVQQLIRFQPTSRGHCAIAELLVSVTVARRRQTVEDVMYMYCVASVAAVEKCAYHVTLTRASSALLWDLQLCWQRARSSSAGFNLSQVYSPENARDQRLQTTHLSLEDQIRIAYDCLSLCLSVWPVRVYN